MATLIHDIETHLLDFIGSVYDLISWPGVILLMAVESAAIPLPSELIMPLAGWMLIKEKELGFEWVFFAGFCGALGNTLGSLVAYYAGAWGGRPLVGEVRSYILDLSPRPQPRGPVLPALGSMGRVLCAR